MGYLLDPLFWLLPVTMGVSVWLIVRTVRRGD